ncbi:MAG: hypothetical protein IPM75_13290 [Candidatus Competibacteraceae bacterium]|nr:hypothetical protein [Candidatus Competibacteraceae bacterium]
MSPETVAAATANPAKLRGLTRFENGRLGLAVVFPLFSRDGVSGVAALATDLKQPLNGLLPASKTACSIADGERRLEYATQPALWPSVAEAVTGDRASAPARGGSGFLPLVRLPASDLLERPSVTLFASRDITAAYWRELIGGLPRPDRAGPQACSLSALYWYMRRSFKPLNAIIGVW